ncbi:MAG: ion channel [Pseudomonadota bacterium]
MDNETLSFKAKTKQSLISLYHGASLRSKLFRRTLLAFDIFAILFFVVISLFENTLYVRFFEYIIAVVIFLDFAARLWICPNRIAYLTQITTVADIIVLISLLVPILFENFLFLRIIRALRLLRSYHIVKDLRQQSPYFRQHEDVIQSVLNLCVFIFIVTALVYVLQVRINPQISNYIDALYFTVTTLTTTGFGDITLQGSSGRLLAVIIMVVGVALFLRLIQTIFQPPKVHAQCPDCGLKRHDFDAVHCKHCGNTIHIETNGFG